MVLLPALKPLCSGFRLLHTNCPGRSGTGMGVCEKINIAAVLESIAWTSLNVVAKKCIVSLFITLYLIFIDKKKKKNNLPNILAMLS